MQKIRVLLFFSLMLGWLYFIPVTIYAQDCSAIPDTIRTNSGTFHDGSGEESEYGNELECRWLIIPSGGSNIRISFNYFNIETNYDELHIYKGTDESAEPLAVYTGNTIPDTTVFDGDTLLVKFITDFLYTYEGWEMNFEGGIINDSPEFNNQQFSINEQSLPGDHIGQLSANDPDGDKVTFHIESGNEEGIFNLNPTTGELTLAYSDIELDYESQSSYTLGVLVTDNVDTIAADVTINVNDIDESLAPIIEDQSFTIPETIPIWEHFGEIIATDPEGNALTYRMASKSDAFSLTYEMAKVRNTNFIDFESSSTMTFEVGISNGTYDSRALITVNILDVGCESSTTFTANKATFSDGSGEYRYDENSECEWLIQPEGGGPVRITFNEVDLQEYYDVLSIYEGASTSDEILVSIDDNSIPKSIISHADTTLVRFTSDSRLNYEGWEISYENAIEDDNVVPSVEETSLGVLEDRAIGDFIGNLEADDGDNDKLYYTIIAGNTNNDFTIDYNTGEITVANELDASVIPSYDLSVEVTDKLDTVLATVTIDVIKTENAEKPNIEDQSFTIHETIAEEQTVGVLEATDPGNMLLQYRLLSGDTDNHFVLSNSGELTINSELDFEDQAVYNLEVEVDNEAKTDTATVTVNLEDVGCASSTVLTSSSGTITDGSGDYNYDNNSLCEWLIQPDTEAPIRLVFNKFHIEKNYDNLRIFNAENSYNEYYVTAYTGDEIPETIVIDTSVVLLQFWTDGSINYEGWEISYSEVDVAPVINDQQFTVDENVPDESHIGNVVATDANRDDITYNILSGNEENIFALGSTGTLTVNNASLLDYESITTYTLVVEVDDGEYSSSASITININNVGPSIDDQVMDIDENSDEGSVVGTVDAMETASFAIISGDPENAFKIDTSTGVISVNSTGVLDYETTSTYSLQVEGQDGLTSDTASVTVNINDVKPTITDQTFSIDENTANGTEVGMISATEAISYSIVSGNSSNAFSLNDGTGKLEVNNASALDFESKAKFNLTINVSDGNSSASATITVTINDIEEAVTSIRDNSNDKLVNIYPVPAKSNIHIKYTPKESGHTDINIYDSSGKLMRKLYSGTINQYLDHTFNLELQNGVYLIKIESNEVTIIEKILVSKD